MGTMHHHAIVVTTFNAEFIQPAIDKAKELGCIVIGPSETAVNGYVTMLVCPDGSKEGWEASHEGDRQRDTFVKWLKGKHQAAQMCTWVEVEFGELGRKIVRGSRG